MICPNCQGNNPDGAVRCTHCGYTFNSQAAQPASVDTSWKKDLRSTGLQVVGIVFGIILLAGVFSCNSCLSCAGFAGLSTTEAEQANSSLGVTIFFTVVAALSLIGGLILLILSVKSFKKNKKHNAELTEKHQADIEAEKAARERQRQEQERQKQLAQAQAQAAAANQPYQSAFNAGTTGKMLFELNGTLSTLQVYEDRILHIAKTTARSYVAGKFFNGTKEYFYEDLTNVQFREATKRINGYLQFDYPGAVNISNSGFGGAGGNFNSENSFVFDINVRAGAAVLPGEDPVAAANRIVSDVYRYIHGRIVEEKKAKRAANVVVAAPQATAAPSAADELKKYNELLQSGAITQEEYDEIKKKFL